jgi:UDP-N-acetyl-alpha-D-muramoyl-L-alanyl-L-glutamate epimerase
MSKYQQFIFEGYHFDHGTRTLTFTYSMDGVLPFTETYRFDFDFVTYDEAALDRACQLLFFLAGTSYFKTYFPPQIVVKAGQIDTPLAAFLGETYQKGFGEFFYMNQMDPNTTITFPVNSEPLPPIQLTTPPEGLLIGVGGGKDSLVSIELLRDQQAPVTTWSLNHRPQLTPLVERIGLPHAWVDRTWDPVLLEIKDQPDAFNGHVPISAIFAACGAVVALLTGRRDVVVSNEQSANEPTMNYRGVDINHQYSKSQAFEQLFQEQLGRSFREQIRYYSFLRPLSEVMIGRMFAQTIFDKYKDVFSSCNRAFVHGSDRMSWCGVCAKCAFVYLVLSPFIPEAELTKLWNGKNLLRDPGLETMYRQLLGIEGDKPFDCVGEVKEARSAMRVAQARDAELAQKYQFDIPEDYNYAAMASHHMPQEYYDVLSRAVAALPQLGEQRA